MAHKQVLSLYLVTAIIITALLAGFNPNFTDQVSAQPDDGIDGYQELHEDWTVKVYEEYTDEIVALYGDLTVESGGHLVLINCTIMMMSEPMQPYEIIVNDGGILEIYNGYITDTPDDDDTELISAYYYFVARSGSTLIIEDSIVRQNGFIDMTDPEHLGLSISTNSGYIRNSRINSTIIGLAFFGNNSGFFVENTNISQISMTPIMMNNAEGVLLSNLTFSETGESNVVDAQFSTNFVIENLNLEYDQHIQTWMSSGFVINNLVSDSSERALEIRTSNDFLLTNIVIIDSDEFNTRIEIEQSTNFTIDNVSAEDNHNVINMQECSFGTIKNLVGFNVSGWVDGTNSDNITVTDSIIGGRTDGGEHVIRFSESQYIKLDRITITNGSRPIYYNTVNESSISNFTITGVGDTAIILSDHSANITVSSGYIETDSQNFVNGIWIDYSSDMIVRDIETFNVNLSLWVREGNVIAENIVINGTVEQDNGIKLEWTGDAYLANITMNTDVNTGIYLWDVVGNSTRVDNLYINNAINGIYPFKSNMTVDNVKIGSAIHDFRPQNDCYITIMNSTVDVLTIWDSVIVLINTTNTSAANFIGVSQLLTKWWLDVYVEDKTGPVSGAEVSIIDVLSTVDARGVSGSDGFARNLAVTEVIWTFGPTADIRNPHRTEASGPGWFAQNLTLYQVDTNMRVDITFNGNAPPLGPTNLVARSDEMSNIILAWEPSISLDVVDYHIYWANTWSDLMDYVSAPVPIPNATVFQTNYTHLGASANWDLHYYAVTTWDGENESDEWTYAACGDWVVNSTSPQFIENMDIVLEGSLLIFGDLNIVNTTIKIGGVPFEIYGVFVNDTGSLIADNFSVKRKASYPYYFKIQPNANVVINASKIQEPGTDDPTDDESIKGIHSLTENLTVTNTTIEVRSRGLGIHGVSDFKGLLYNISFSTIPSPDPAEYYIKIKDSSNVSVSNCSMEGWTLSGIFAESSSNIQVYGSRIDAHEQDGSFARGIFFIECTDSRIYDNPFLKGVPPVHIYSCNYVTIENSNISSHSLDGILVELSWYTTIKGIYYDTEGERPDIGIHMSWCRESKISDITSGEINYFLLMENESYAVIDNVSITSGDMGITLVNSDNVLFNNTYITFIQNGMSITGCRDITLTNCEINLTLLGLQVKSPGPIYLIDCVLASCISGELYAEGYEGELGNVILENSTLIPISDESIILNNSGVVHLLNTPLNDSLITIEDGASRVEIYHYLSLQVYDIDNGIPIGASINIMNSKEVMVYDSIVAFGYADWILIHEKTMFKDSEYVDNPHNIYFYDGSHFGNVEVYINYTQHIDVRVSNQAPWISFIAIAGFFDNPFPIPDDITLQPTTDYDIILNYTYEDLEGDPESGTIIHWYINGVYNATFNNTKTIDSQYTKKGQLWQAYVYPSDGYDSTFPALPFESNIIAILNTPPSVSNVTITPSDPTGGDDLYVDFEVNDIDGDGLDSSKTTSKWYRYNEVSEEWEYSTIDSFYLSSQYTAKGEKWKCEITPHDGDDAGLPVDSHNVTIGNSPPSIPISRIVAETGGTLITGADNLKAQYLFTDPDGDEENGTVYEWYHSLDGSNWTLYNVNLKILPNSYTQRGDLWRCRMLPSDGEDFGAEAWTEPVEIFNTPPVISNITIVPQFATSEDSLKVTYDFYDYDGDEDNGTSFHWIYEDVLGFKDSGIHGNVTPPGAVVKQQTWYCNIIPSDGISSGQEVSSEGVLIHNTAPSVDEATVELITTDLERHLSLSYEFSDIDGDQLGTIEITWYKNGNVQNMFEDNYTVTDVYLFKGDNWHVQLRVSDGEDWSSTYSTDPLQIPNKAPILNGTPTLSPSRAKSNQSLTPIFQDLYLDEDGDLLTDYEIKWYRDNGHMEDYDGMQQISWDLTGKGEIWYYKIRVSDGEDESEWYSSTTTVIENSPASDIVRSPSTESEITVTETYTQEFNVSAVDIDDDQLSYRWTLDGRIVLLDEGVGTSIYLLKTDYDFEGEYILRLVITDGDDSKEITWNVNVLKRNRLPEISVVEPEGRTARIKENEDLKFAITKSDDDGDNLDVVWYIDGVQVWEGSDKYTYSPGYASSGTHTITAEARETDSGANVTTSWEVAVADVAASREELFGMSYDFWGLIMALISGAVAILLFIWGLYRVRQKKGRLKEHMVEMDTILDEEEDPEVIEDKLVEFEARIKDEFAQGKLEDLHFLMLQEIIASKKTETRKAEVTSKFGRLPKNVLEDLDEMLKDGKISRDEYEDFVATISKSESLSPSQKEELSKMIGEWKEEDKDTAGPDSTSEEPKEDAEGEQDDSSEKEESKSENDDEIEDSDMDGDSRD